MKRDTVVKVKFKRLQRQLKLPLWQAVGLLEALWHCTITNAPDGDIGRLSNDDIAAAIEWDDDADNLVNALVQTGWLDADDEFRLIVHDWSQHIPTYLKGAYEKHGKKFADQSAKHRAKQDTKQGAKEGAKQDALEGAGSGATYPSLAKPSLAKPIQSEDCPETGEPSSGPAALLGFPCDGSPQLWTLTEKHVADWALLFPSLDIEAECKAALAWVLATPDRRKTARGMPKFLVGWFGRSQNRGGTRGSSANNPFPKIKENE